MNTEKVQVKIYMTKRDKELLSSYAKAHGVSLSLLLTLSSLEKAGFSLWEEKR